MEELLHPLDEPFEPLPEARQALLDRFKNYAVWHPRLVQVQTHVNASQPRVRQQQATKLLICRIN